MPQVTDRRQILERQALQLRDRLARIRRDAQRADGALEADFAEQAVQRENDEVLHGLEASVQAELGQIDRALQHLDAGWGERCELCGGLIAPARLAALPQATRCADCARAATA